MGWRKTLTFLRWGPEFVKHRGLLQSSFTKPNCIPHRELQESETLKLIDGIMRKPQQWETLLRRFATAIVLGIGFGVSIEKDDDHYVQMAIDASYALGHGGAPAGTLVDFFPLGKYLSKTAIQLDIKADRILKVRHLPSWLVRSRTLKFARDWKWAIRQIHEGPFADVRKQMAEGIAQPSFIHTLLENRELRTEKGEKNDLSIEDIKGSAGAIYAAGQDTVSSSLDAGDLR